MIRFLQTPGPIKKIVLGGLLLFISAAMVISLGIGGLNSSFGGPKAGVLATVGTQEITDDDANRAFEQTIRAQYPQAASQANAIRPFLFPRIFDQLVGQKVMLEEAHRLGLKATDDEVRDELQHGHYAAYFFPDGKYVGDEQYQAMLSNANLTPERFEASVKDEIALDKLRNLVGGAAVVSELDVRREFEQHNMKVKFEYAVLTRDEILKGIHPSDAELKSYFDTNKPRYTNAIPEKRKVRYVLIDNAKLQAQAKVTPDQLQAYYNQHRDEFRVAEQVNVRHILIKTPVPGPDGKADQKGVDAARAKAEDVLKQLKGGAKFEDLAKKYSEDPGSASNGGSLGWIGKGRTVPEFEKSAFSLAKGGTSDLVQSSYGFHIIHVDDKKEAGMKTLDEVKAQIEPIVQQQEVATVADAQGKDLLSAATTNGLDKAAAAKGLQVVSTDFFSRADSLPGIGNAPDFQTAVFSTAENAPPGEVQIQQGTVIFQVTGVKPPATPTFDEIRSRVETDFKDERSSALLAQKTQELSDRAKTSHDLKKAAKEEGATVKTSDFVSRDGQVPDIGSMTGSASVAFTMKPGEISGPIEGAGNGVVLSVLEQQEPSADDFAAKQAGIRDALRGQKQDELFTLYITSVRDQMQKAGKIKINQDEMKKLSGSSRDEGE